MKTNECIDWSLTADEISKQYRDLVLENERLNKALKWEENRAGRVGTHGPGCAYWGPSHFECLLRLNEELVDALEEIAEWSQELQDQTVKHDMCLMSWRACVGVARNALEKARKE